MVSAFCSACVDQRVVWRQMRQVHFFAVGLADQLDGFFEHGHHAEAEQVHFDDAHIGAIFLVPLHDHAAGHGGGLERDDGIELALADHHAAGMLAEVARQILDGHVEIQEFRDQRMLSGAKPASRNWRSAVSLGSVQPQAGTSAEMRARSGSSKPSTLPMSRAAERPR